MATLSKSVTLVEFKRSLVPAKWEDSVRVIGLSECREAAVSLAHSFAADELSQYLLDCDDMAAVSAEDKWRLHVDIMHYMVTATCLNGIATTIGPDYEGVALWMPPGKSFGDWWTTLRSGSRQLQVSHPVFGTVLEHKDELWRLYFQLSVEGRKRFFEEMLPLLHGTKTAVLGERNAEEYYLLYLGTKPSARGRGYAKKLLEHTLEKADSEARPVYLESSSPSNDVYYRKFGFDLKRDVCLGRGAAPVRLSIMVREPQHARRLAYAGAVVKLQAGRKL